MSVSFRVLFVGLQLRKRTGNRGFMSLFEENAALGMKRPVLSVLRERKRVQRSEEGGCREARDVREK